MKSNWPIKKLGEIVKNKKDSNGVRIPSINRNGKLVSRLMVVVLGGFDGVLDKESRLYLRLLGRLVDKSYDEYTIAKECIDEEIKEKDKLEYRFAIINHLENCLNAINRVSKIFRILVFGNKNVKKNFNILNFISKESIKKLKKYKVSTIRNRVEHIDEDIYENKFESGLFLDVNGKYEKVCINNRCLSLSELALIIENYHNFVLEIFDNLPNRIQDGVYYYDKK
jgi:hypothetical protein